MQKEMTRKQQEVEQELEEQRQQQVEDGSLPPLPDRTVAPRVVESNPAAGVAFPVVGALVGSIFGPVGFVAGAGIGAFVAAGTLKSRHTTIAKEIFPYGIKYIHILPEGTVEQGGVQYHTIVITPENGPRWKVMRRYNDFVSLWRSLPRRCRKSVLFPPRCLFKLRGKALRIRIGLLEQWLRLQIKLSEKKATVGTLRPFLENQRVAFQPTSTVTANHQQGELPDAPLQMPAPTLSVVVPDGVSPGQALSVLCPDGRTVMVTVPAGALPGMEVQVVMPIGASAGATVGASSPGNGMAADAVVSSTAEMPTSAPVTDSKQQQPSRCSSSSSSPPSDGARSGAGEVLSIEVPPGTSGGESIAMEVHLQLPPGAQAGETLCVWYDPSSKNVAPITDLASPPEADATQLLSVRVPPSVPPGGWFAVLCPDGRQLPVELPSSSEGVAEIHVRFNASTGTLTVVH